MGLQGVLKEQVEWGGMKMIGENPSLLCQLLSVVSPTPPHFLSPELQAAGNHSRLSW